MTNSYSLIFTTKPKAYWVVSSYWGYNIVRQKENCSWNQKWIQLSKQTLLISPRGRVPASFSCCCWESMPYLAGVLIGGIPPDRKLSSNFSFLKIWEIQRESFGPKSKTYLQQNSNPESNRRRPILFENLKSRHRTSGGVLLHTVL